METIFRYEIDYEEAEAQAQNMVTSLLESYADVDYSLLTVEGDGVFIRLFGDEAKVRKIGAAMRKKEMELLLAGTPVYIIYGGRSKAAA